VASDDQRRDAAIAHNAGVLDAMKPNRHASV